MYSDTGYTGLQISISVALTVYPSKGVGNGIYGLRTWRKRIRRTELRVHLYRLCRPIDFSRCICASIQIGG